MTTPHKSTNTASWRLLVVVVLTFALLALPGPASAAAPEFLFSMPSDLAAGDTAGKLDHPRGIVQDPMTGHFYVSDSNNARISEFDAWGEFVKAWGWDVAPGPVDEEQEVSVRASAGEFRLIFEGDSTDNLAYNADAAEVEAALNSLPVVAGNGSVSVEGGPGAANGGTPYVIHFDGGSLAASDVAELTAASGTAPLTNGTPFTAATVGMRANGTAGGTGLEACTSASGCKEGSTGEGAGQFVQTIGGGGGKGITLDSSRNIYVYDSGQASQRVQKFSPEGEFLLMFGGEVNKTTLANVCTKEDLENGDECGAGVAGLGDGQFSGSAFRNFISYNTVTNSIFVGGSDRIQEFGMDGVFVGETELDGIFNGKTVQALAADQVSGDLYASFVDTANVFRFDPDLAILAEAEDLVAEPLPAPKTAVTEGSIGLTVDIGGNVYVVNTIASKEKLEVLGFDPQGAPRTGMKTGDRFGAPPTQGLDSTAVPTAPAIVTGVLSPNSNEPGNLYIGYFTASGRSYLDIYGSAPIAFGQPPLHPPAITAQYAVAVDNDAATVKARINPRFWDDAAYRVQYASEACLVGGWEAPCVAEHPASPGASLTGGQIVNAEVLTSAVFLDELAASTAYRYRFVAQSGGGVVRGVGGTETVDGAEGRFRTFPAVSERPDACPNRDVRIGPAADLPDCRAYELVSPLEKNNADIIAARNAAKYLSGLHVADPTGQRLTYSSFRSFGSPDGSPFTSQYLAVRDPQAGWLGEAISPPIGRITQEEALPLLDNEFALFSPDLCNAWLRSFYEWPEGEELPPESIAEYPNLYRRANCGPGKGTFAGLTPSPPPHVGPPAYIRLSLQGASADGAKAIYTAPDNLPVTAGNAAPSNTTARKFLYRHRADGEVRFLCVLPNGKPIGSAQHCYAGTLNIDSGTGRLDTMQSAISTDGSRVFWTATGNPTGPGQIYAWNEDAPTIDVSAAAEALSGTTASRFWGAAASGEEAVIQTGNDLYRVAVDAGQTTPIAGDVEGVLGIGDDASHVYFVSREELTTEPNDRGDSAEDGLPNLYLDVRGEGVRFIGALAEVDMGEGGEGKGPNPVSRFPTEHLSRVTPSGHQAAFISAASLTGYDNTDVNRDEPIFEVFTYDAVANEVLCVSCNPSGARPTGRELPLATNDVSHVWAAARLPGFERALHDSRILSEDGERLFFESYESLVPRDTNGKLDVYQWERAGKGGCEQSDASFSPEAKGCVDLITSGTSPRDSLYLDSSASGDDVFFTTLSSLVPWDYGLVDVYDARVGGGFPPPPTQPEECEGDACQTSPPAPPALTPASSAFRGPGDPRSKAPPSCRKLSKRAKGASRKAREAKGEPQGRALGRKAKRLSGKARACRVRARQGGSR